MVSTLEPKVAQATLQYVERTAARITRVLDGVARGPELGKEILVVFDDQDTYYRYVSIYHAGRGVRDERRHVPRQEVAAISSRPRPICTRWSR